MLAAFLVLQGLICANEKQENEKKLKIKYVTKQANVTIVNPCGSSALSGGCQPRVEQLANGQFAWGSVVPKKAVTGELVYVGQGVGDQESLVYPHFGCEKEDYSGANFTGRAALIYNSNFCTYETKVKLAAEAGAAIVVVRSDISFAADYEDLMETMFIGQAEKYKVISLMIQNERGREAWNAVRTGENLLIELSALGGSEPNNTTTLGAENIIFFLFCLLFF